MSAAQVKAQLLNSVDPLNSLEGKVKTGGRINMARMFGLDPELKGATNNLKSQSNIESKNQPEFTYDITLENIDSASKSMLEDSIFGVFVGNRIRRDNISKKIENRISDNKGNFGLINDFNGFDILDNPIAIMDFEDRDIEKTRGLLKFMLEKNWFEGYDVNEQIESIEPIAVENPFKLLASSTSPAKSPDFKIQLADSISKYRLAKGTSSDVFAGKKADKIIGNNLGTKLFGEQGNDILRGKNGDDWLYGGAGKDMLSGGNGDDVIFTGKNKDIIVFGAGRDLVRDFSLDQDRIKINSDDILYTQLRGGLQISIQGESENSILLEGIDKAYFLAADPLIG